MLKKLSQRQTGRLGELRALRVLFLLAVMVLTLHAPCLANRKQKTSKLLEQATAAKNPAEKIELLTEALRDKSLRGEKLSHVFFERGRAYKEMNDCFRAIEDFSSALAHSRKVLAALLEKAECLIRVDQPEEASADVERYLSINPRDAHAYVLKGMTYEKRGFITKAEDEYSRALYYNNKSTLALASRAKVRLKSGKPRLALEDANYLCKLTPKDPSVFLLRARIFVKLKEHAAALEDYTRVESLAPGDNRVLPEKVLVYFQTGQAKKALEALSTKSDELQYDVRYLVLRARAYILLGNYRKADQILKRSVKIAPDHAPAYLYSGVVAMHRKLMDEALDYFNRALALDKNLVEAYKERARTFIRLGENVRAADDLTTAADLDPADAEIFRMRGITYMNRLLYDASVRDFSRALDNLPGDPEILFDRAVANYRRDDLDAALSDLNRVVQARPDSARGRSFRGVVLFRLGKLSSAREDLEEATRIEPKDAQVWNNLGFFRFKTGDTRGAMDALNVALRLNPKYGKARYNLTRVLKKEETMNTATANQLVPASQEATLSRSFATQAP